MVESKVVNVEQEIEEDCNLNILKQIINTSEPMKTIIIKYLLSFQSYQMDCKEIKCPLQWCDKHEIMFLTIDLLTYQILNIVKSQIETMRIIRMKYL
jgi:hypothetical protein